MRCYICDHPDTIRDERTGKFICVPCNESWLQAIEEFDTEKCTTVWKENHGIREEKKAE